MRRLIRAIQRSTFSQWWFAGKLLAGGSGGRSGCAGAGTWCSPECCARTDFVHRICARYSAFSRARRWNSFAGEGGRPKRLSPTTGCASGACVMNRRFIAAASVGVRCPSSWPRGADAPRGRLIPRARWGFLAQEFWLAKRRRHRPGKLHVHHFPNKVHGSLELVGLAVADQRVPLRRIARNRLEGRKLAVAREKSIGGNGFRLRARHAADKPVTHLLVKNLATR